MAPPPRRPHPPPPELEPGATADTDEEPAYEPEAGPADTDEVQALVPRRGKVPMRRTGRPPVRDPNRRVPTSRDEPKKRSRLVPVLLLAVIGVGGAVAFKKLNPGAVEPPPQPKGLEGAKLAFQEGKNLVRKGQWKAAAQQFDQAEKLAADLEGIKPYLDAAKVEVPLQEHLDAVDAALDKNELGHAAKELAAVPQTTQQISRRTEVEQRLEKVVKQRLKDARVLSGDPTKMHELKALVEDVLAARPEDRDALAYLEMAKLALQPKVAAPIPVGDPARGVVDSWSGGDATGAFAQADACSAKSPRCTKLKEQIAQAIAQHKKLESLEEKELLELVRLDKAISGGPQSAIGKQAGVRLAAVLTPKASSAAAMKQWKRAIELSLKILEGDPGNTAAKDNLKAGYEAADELFHRCYVGRASTPEEALPMCREAVDMLPEGHPIRKKAQGLLDGPAKNE